jgi:Fe-S cluster biosynthesis and repair protein YggX
MLAPPFPGALGEKIFKEVSQEQWQAWIARQTMLINEYRLNVLEDAAKQFLKDEMIAFLFKS